MFFIGIFGIEQKQKQIGSHSNTVCINCDRLTRFEILKTYSYFHVFFIPTFKWNVKYYVTSVCCDNFYELDSDIGKQYENGESPEIRQEHLHSVEQFTYHKTCTHCSAKVESKYSFCPYCGKEL